MTLVYTHSSHTHTHHSRTPPTHTKNVPESRFTRKGASENAGIHTLRTRTPQWDPHPFTQNTTDRNNS